MKRPLSLFVLLLAAFPFWSSGLSGHSAPSSALSMWEADQPNQTLLLQVVPGSQAVNLAWQVDADADVSAFIIERDDDAKGFHVAGGVRAKAGNSSYTFTDSGYHGEVYRYRIRIHYTDGQTSYSEVHQVLPSASQNLSMYPNPVEDKLFISSGTLDCADCELTLYSLDGNRIPLSPSSISQSSTLTTLNLPASLPTGMYLVQMTNGQKSWFGRMMKQ